MFQYSILEHTLEEWQSKVAVYSYAYTILAKAMALSLLYSLSLPPGSYLLRDIESPRIHPWFSQRSSSHT